MKLFEEFENDLRDVNSVKGLAKIMLANGVKSIEVGNEIAIKVTEFCLIENVPQELWNVESVGEYSRFIVVRQGLFVIECRVDYEEAFTARTGFKFPAKERKL